MTKPTRSICDPYYAIALAEDQRSDRSIYRILPKDVAALIASGQFEVVAEPPLPPKYWALPRIRWNEAKEEYEQW